MEAMGGELAVEVREQGRRIDGHHKRIGGAEVKLADVEKAIVGLEHDVEDLDEKFDEIKRALANSDQERRQENAQHRRALYALAATMGTFTIALCGLIATLLGNA